jgi:hypothetical protein
MKKLDCPIKLGNDRGEKSAAGSIVLRLNQNTKIKAMPLCRGIAFCLIWLIV